MPSPKYAVLMTLDLDSTDTNTDGTYRFGPGMPWDYYDLTSGAAISQDPKNKKGRLDVGPFQFYIREAQFRPFSCEFQFALKSPKGAAPFPKSEMSDWGKRTAAAIGSTFGDSTVLAPGKQAVFTLKKGKGYAWALDVWVGSKHFRLDPEMDVGSDPNTPRKARPKKAEPGGRRPAGKAGKRRA